jgi:hypothetical protein
MRRATHSCFLTTRLIALKPQMYYLVSVAAVGETITTYDVPHSSLVSTPIKAHRLREISQATIDRPKPVTENTGVKKSSSAIDRYFAEVGLFGAEGITSTSVMLTALGL